MRTKSKTLGYNLFLWVPFSVLILFVGGALLWNFGISFVRWYGYGPITNFAGFKNYQIIFADEHFWKAFGNAFLFIIPNSIIPTILGVLIASLLFDFLSTRRTEKLTTFIRSSLYLPQIIPVMITGIIWRWILDPGSGSLNPFLKSIGLKSLALDWVGDGFAAMISISIVLIWIQLGYAVVIFMSGLSRMNPYIVEAAQVDGANWWQRFRYVTSRELGPELAVVTLTSVIGSLKVFAPVYWLTGGGPDAATMVPSVYSFRAFFGGNQIGYASAVTVVLAALIIVVALVMVRAQRKVLRGEE